MRTRPDGVDGGALFLALVFANLLPVFWFSHLPSADGPSHVYNATLFARYFLNHADPVRGVVEFNASLPPNLVAHAGLALFAAVMSPTLAERTLVACYAVLLPVAFRYALRGVSRETHGLEFLGLAFVFNQHLHWGFYNFLAGLVTYLFAIGYWLRIRQQPSPRALAAMTGLVTMIYFCHPVPLVACWITMGCLWAVDAVEQRKWSVVELRSAAISAVPAAGFYAHYLLTKLPAPSVQVEWSTLRYAGSVLVRLYPLATYTAAERWGALAISATLAIALAWIWATRAPRNDVYLYVSLLLATMIFVSPSQAAGGTLITPRLVYFPLFLILFWMASVHWPAAFKVGFMTVAIAVAAIGHLARWPIYDRYDRRMSTFLNLVTSRDARPVEYFQIAGTSLTVNLDSGGIPYLSAGAAGYAAAERRSVLMDYEPRLGYFPFRYRAGLDPVPFAALPGCPLAGGGLVDERSYRQATGVTIDTQLVWMNADQPDSARCVRRYDRQPSAERHTADGTLAWFDYRE